MTLIPRPCLIAAFGLFVRLGLADHPENGVDKYVTRPDIVSPQWNVTIYDESALVPGYWFLTPYEKVGQRQPGGAWIGPHIYDQWGGLIWSGSYLFNDTNVMDFKLSNVRGHDRLTMMYPVEGMGYVYDNNYELVKKVPVGQSRTTLNMHEFHYVEDGKTLLLLKRNHTYATHKESAKTGYNETCHVTWEGFEELDTKNYRTKFRWSTWDHIGLDESTMDKGPVEDRCEGQPWDYIHTNALDKFADGHYLLSGRHTDTIYKISKDDGHIIWRLGGRYNDFEIGAANFSRQHHARFLSQNDTHTLISVLDNARGADRQQPTSPNSRGLIISLRTDTTPMKAELVAHYDHPKGRYTYRRGNFQILSNKNAFLCWSEQSFQSEHRQDGSLIMEARMVPNWIGTYRSFKYEYVGLPRQPPDIVSKTESRSSEDESMNTVVFVSWNGATEVRSWNFYKSTANGTTQAKIGSAERSGFETKFTWEGYASYVLVEGLDKNNNSLGFSKIIRTEQPTNLNTSDVKAEMQWLQDAAEGKVRPEGAWWIQEKLSSQHPTLGVLAFLAGLVSSPVLLFACFKFQRRRYARSWKSWKDAKDGALMQHYDGFDLDDLRSDSPLKDSDSEQVKLDESEDDQSDAEFGRVNARTPYESHFGWT